MRRLLATAALCFALSGCAEGCADAGIPTPHGGEGRQGWYPITDPETGDRFRCFYWSLKESTALWCYPLDRNSDE